MNVRPPPLPPELDVLAVLLALDAGAVAVEDGFDEDPQALITAATAATATAAATRPRNEPVIQLALLLWLVGTTKRFLSLDVRNTG